MIFILNRFTLIVMTHRKNEEMNEKDVDLFLNDMYSKQQFTIMFS